MNSAPFRAFYALPSLSAPDVRALMVNKFVLKSYPLVSVGGCTVSLVRASEIDNVIKQIDSAYHGATFYVCAPADGARAIDLGNLN